MCIRDRSCPSSQVAWNATRVHTVLVIIRNYCKDMCDPDYEIRYMQKIFRSRYFTILDPVTRKVLLHHITLAHYDTIRSIEPLCHIIEQQYGVDRILCKSYPH